MLSEHEERFSPDDLTEAVDDMAMLPGFPAGSRDSVIALLARMVPHKRALKWLIAETVNHVGKWPGPAELRGILCTRFDPVDGVDQWSTLPGYCAADQEQKYLEEAEARKRVELSNTSTFKQIAAGAEHAS